MRTGKRLAGGIFGCGTYVDPYIRLADNTNRTLSLLSILITLSLSSIHANSLDLF